MISVNQKYVLNILSLVAGCLVPLAFAPFNCFIIAPISIAILLFILLRSNAKQAAFHGWLFGLGMFGVGVSWVYISIHRFGNTAIPLALFITILFIIVLSLFPALMGYLLNRLFPQNRYSKILLVFPAGWVLFEWIRAWLFTGFPWLFLGFSQTNSPLKGYAPIIGSYGLSFLTALTGALLLIIILHIRADKWLCEKKPTTHHKSISELQSGKKSLWLCISLIAIIWIGGYGLSFINWTKEDGKPLTASLIQGNIPQATKWSPESILPTMKRYQHLTEQHWKSDLILWPESAIPVTLQIAKDYLYTLSLFAQQHQTSIILGLPIRANATKFYNSAIAIGSGDGIYNKRHLVPFGEYLPFEHWLRGLINFFNIPMSDFIPGKIKQDLLTVKHTKVALFICYEVAYSLLVRSDLPAAKLLITITNDAWFGDSFAAAQHLQMGIMRALETGRYMLFSSNNGITAIIKPNGKILCQLPRFKTNVLTNQVYKMKGSTPWIIFGDWPIVILAFMLYLIGFVARKKK